MCVAYSTDYIQQCQTLSIDFHTKYIRPAASSPIKPTTLPAFLIVKFQLHEQLRLVCILHKWLILVGIGTEYSYSCSLSQYTVYGAYHFSMICLKVSSRFPPMPSQIKIWAVSNLTFVLLSFTLLHSTTEVPFIAVALYSLRPGTLKHVNGDDTCAGYKYVFEALYIPFQTLYIIRNHCTEHYAMKQKLFAYLQLKEIHVEICKARR